MPQEFPLVTISLLVLMLLSGVTQTGSPGEKNARTPAQRKMSSALLEAVRTMPHDPARSADGGANGIVKIDPKQRALVDVRTPVSTDMKQRITSLGGTIVSESAAADSIIAWVPLIKMERLAEHGAVRAIEPAAQPTTNR